MTYKALHEEAVKAKRTKQLTAEYREWKKAGDFVIGMLLAKNPVGSTLGEGTYAQYLFETDSGLVKCALGKATDNEAGAVMEIGKIYHIEFKGKVEISGGRRVNQFNVTRIITEEEAKVGDAEDKAF